MNLKLRSVHYYHQVAGILVGMDPKETPSFEAFAKQWIQKKYGPLDEVKITTIAHYESRAYVAPAAGNDAPLTQVEWDIVEAFRAPDGPAWKEWSGPAWKEWSAS